jgi:endonuclease I
MHTKPTLSGKMIFSGLLMLLNLWAIAQPPSGYYNGTENLQGEELKSTLKNIIDDHDALSYSAIWNAFYDTDAKPNGKVWDMYSDVPNGTPPYEYTFGSDQCGNYSGEGSCYNREHSFPKSWFDDASPMITDLFHIVATDGYVNGQRGNYPFGETGSASWTSLNGSKVGTSNYPGYNGTVFEPIDEYKGDFARGYFYMATRYEDQIADWNSPMLDGTQYPAFSEWALNLLLEWHADDPVSEKEINRNNAVYTYQNNRNPFIDHPEFVNLVWGGETPSVAFSSDPPLFVTEGSLYEYNISASGGNGGDITISCPQKPDWLAFTGGENGTALLSGIPDNSDVGLHEIILEATDGETSDQQIFNLEVKEIIPEIEFISEPVTQAIAGQQYNYTAEATVDGENNSQLMFLSVTLPDWLNLEDQNNGTALLSGTPGEEDTGPHEVEIMAMYLDFQVTQNFTIEVLSNTPAEQYTETFTLMPADNSAYLERNWTGDHNIEWNASQARTDLQIDGRAICLKDAGTPSLQSETIEGGITSLSFQHQQKFSGSGGTLTLHINDQQVGEPVSVTDEVGFAEFDALSLSGNFTIKLVSNGATRIAIDNLSWTTMEDANAPPVIEYITHNPVSPAPDDLIAFLATVTDADGTIEEVLLHYGNTSNNPDQNVAMAPIEDQPGEFATILEMPLLENGNVYYYIEATDDAGATTQSAEFIIIPAPPQEYELSISSQGNGSTQPQEGTYFYPEGTQETLTAQPAAGWIFDKWVINGTEFSENPIDITIDLDIEAVAWFSDPTNATPPLQTKPILYPIPFHDHLVCRDAAQIEFIIISNTLGQQLLFVGKPENRIDTRSLQPGIYFITVMEKDGNITVQKTLKTN